MAESGQPSIFDRDLDRNAANSAALSPLSFLKRAAAVYPNKPAVVHDRVYSYAEFGARARRLTCRRCWRRTSACRSPAAC